MARHAPDLPTFTRTVEALYSEALRCLSEVEDGVQHRAWHRLVRHLGNAVLAPEEEEEPPPPPPTPPRPTHAPYCDDECDGWKEGPEEQIRDERGTVYTWESGPCPCDCHEREEEGPQP